MSNSCSSVVAAALEVIREDCGGVHSLGPGGVIMNVPQEAIDEIGVAPGNPSNRREVEEAVEKCMSAEWSNEMADAFLGEDTDNAVRNMFTERLCRDLFG